MAALGMTQGDLARKAKTSQPIIARLLSGKHQPTLATIERVAKALGIVVTFHTPKE